MRIDRKPDEAGRAALLRKSQQAARFLTEGDVWDNTFGGGCWWSSLRGSGPEGKPVQTTAMAAQLFLRLYEAAAEPRYVDWARASLSWLDGSLLDPKTGLYRYTIRHWDMPAQRGQYLEPRAFSYDQGIMIEVHLLFHRLINPSGGHLERARVLAEQLQATFWDAERGGYHLENAEPDVYAPYSAWLAQSLLALHAVDPEPRWLVHAQLNLEALERDLLDPANGSYAYMQYRCRRLSQPGCEHGAVWALDPTRYLFSQAWMQRAQALLADRLSSLEKSL